MPAWPPGWSDGGVSWPGWEDAAVAPENLAAYLRDFRALLAAHRLTGVLYGHFGAGCVHVRIDFDLATQEGRDATRRFLREAAEVVVRHGGTLSGEHGDGRARSELLDVMYSQEIIGAFAAFKRIFDPDGLLNPGVIVAPSAVDADLALDVPRSQGRPMLFSSPGVALGTPRPEGRPTLFAFPHDEDGFAGAVQRCVGVGRCRGSSGGVMCPSYRATGEENHSTRGRARMLQEMVRGDVVRDGWRAKEVKDALDLCLSCKACSTDCRPGWTWPPTRPSSCTSTTGAGSGRARTTRWAGCPPRPCSQASSPGRSTRFCADRWQGGRVAGWYHHPPSHPRLRVPPCAAVSAAHGGRQTRRAAVRGQLHPRLPAGG
ncbi:FAD-binding and (Fe-S)-binding domain-containing protein, partial [Lentzea indica]|uniref:FAD-binding and (Fe-S)-binding domain-containing protein n=1 Tax=Lentzea indica TaxID=2604800 RepID=UPI0028AF6BD9